MSTSVAQENHYLQRINAVMAHVCKNLQADLTLDILAQVTRFSPFHFIVSSSPSRTKPSAP